MRRQDLIISGSPSCVISVLNYFSVSRHSIVMHETCQDDSLVSCPVAFLRNTAKEDAHSKVGLVFYLILFQNFQVFSHSD